MQNAQSSTPTAKSFNVTGIDITGYMAKDTERAIKFYRDVLGMEPTTLYPDGVGAEYEFPDGTAFGFWNPGDTMPFQASGGVMFAVDDFDAAVRAAKERGATIHMQHESPVCHMAMAQDSEGNQFILHRRKNA